MIPAAGNTNPVTLISYSFVSLGYKSMSVCFFSLLKCLWTLHSLGETKSSDFIPEISSLTLVEQEHMCEFLYPYLIVQLNPIKASAANNLSNLSTLVLLKLQTSSTTPSKSTSSKSKSSKSTHIRRLLL